MCRYETLGQRRVGGRVATNLGEKPICRKKVYTSLRLDGERKVLPQRRKKIVGARCICALQGQVKGCLGGGLKNAWGANSFETWNGNQTGFGAQKKEKRIQGKRAVGE